MLEINNNGEHIAVCNCCFEQSLRYPSDKELRKGLKKDGWYHRWNPEEHDWETYCDECKEEKE